MYEVSYFYFMGAHKVKWNHLIKGLTKVQKLVGVAGGEGESIHEVLGSTWGERKAMRRLTPFKTK